MKNYDIIDYKVVSSSDVLLFEKHIKEYIKLGWVLYGKMKFKPSDDTYTQSFYQPMVKYKNKF